MSNLTSRPYKPNPQMCCEACTFKRGVHSEWCQAKRLTGMPEHFIPVDPLAQFMGIDRGFADPSMPKDAILLVAQRKQDESEADWLKRCAVIRNVEVDS